MSADIGHVGLALSAVSPAILVSALIGVVPFDIGISIIGVIFAIALIPGIVENHRKKFGWSKTSTVMTASGLLSMGTMFLVLGLPFTGSATVVSGLLWSILTAQAFIYGRSGT